MAAAVAFLAAPDAGYITGQVLAVDGGDSLLTSPPIDSDRHATAADEDLAADVVRLRNAQQVHAVRGVGRRAGAAERDPALHRGHQLRAMPTLISRSSIEIVLSLPAGCR